eukprot:5716531-Pyramimonas_sp.AAC.1
MNVCIAPNSWIHSLPKAARSVGSWFDSISWPPCHREADQMHNHAIPVAKDIALDVLFQPCRGAGMFSALAVAT